jgi:hypothetical protein
VRFSTISIPSGPERLTNVDGLDLDALLLVSGLGVVRNLVLKDFILAEGIHEGGATSTRGT